MSSQRPQENEMLVWIDGPSGPSAPAAPNHYAIIRRNGNLVPFEPQLIAQAMMKAFLAVHQTMRKGCTGNSLFFLRNPPSSPVSQWYSPERLEVRLAKRGGGARLSARRRNNTDLRDGSTSGTFSAAKPNLRNAP
jgi:hypothetical protein